MTATGSVDRGRYGPRRPRRGFTPDAVVRAGRRVIERDGPDALTMRAVATELDTAPASLYRHIADREALLLAILEQLAADLPVDVAGRTPRARLRRRFVAFHDFMARHIWVVHILVEGELMAENALGFTDACIADFRDGGLTVGAAGDAYRACWQFTLGELLYTHPRTPSQRPTQREQVMAGADAVRFPALAAMRDDPAVRTDEARAYERTLDLLVRGLLD